MAFLGTPYRIVYQAKGNQTGLTDVTCMVMKPDNSLVGVFALVEFTPLAFKGFYYTDLVTSILDPEGEWIASISSPTESIKDASRISLQQPIASSAELLEIKELLLDIRGNIMRGEIEASISTIEKVEAMITSIANIKATIRVDEMQAALESAKLAAKIESPSTQAEIE